MARSEIADQESPRTTAGKIADLKRRIDAAVVAGGSRRWILQLLDKGSFVEFDRFTRLCSADSGMEQNRPYGDGVITGHGTVDGRPVAVFSQDLTALGGALGEAFGARIVKIMDWALKNGCPVIGISDSGGARAPEGLPPLGTYGEILRRNTHASGVIPQISLIMGPRAGGAVYSPAITDFVVVVDRTAHMVATGPDVIETVTAEDVGLDELGGTRPHNTAPRCAHLAGDEKDAVEYVRALLSYLPSNSLQDPPVYPERDNLEVSEEDLELDGIVPDSVNQPYDMRKVIERVLDDEEFLETQSLFAPNIVTGLGRVEGHSVAVVANQPMHFAGCLDIDAGEKAARFVRTCDSFGIPVVTFVDVPGFLPAAYQEWYGIIRRGAKLVYAYAEATVPLITVITHRAYGGAYDVMGSRHLGADLNLAWPTAQIAVMGALGAVDVLHRMHAEAEDPEATGAEPTARHEYSLLDPYVAAQRGYVDAVIMPSETRQHIVKGLRALRDKRATLPPKKHGNIPL
ncbi:carboxyl transferase domain-containing protein [Streptomyces sp. NPDC008092]|uniref:acyl-CoA carboxylase subunit beta n=1 Tax=Streptomyces sp. NPDC008092 TaxID=3364808 RepID=UPI0036EFCE01